MEKIRPRARPRPRLRVQAAAVLAAAAALGTLGVIALPRSGSGAVPEPQEARGAQEKVPSAQDTATAIQYLRDLLSRGAPNLKAGARVVLVADGSFDVAVIELLRRLVWEAEGTFDVLLLQGPGKEVGAAQLQLDLWTEDPHEQWPAWVWSSLEGASVVISAFGPDVHNTSPEIRQWFTDRNINRPRFWHATLGTLLVDAIEQGIGYPAELLTALRAASQKQFEGARVVRVQDANGTDFTFSVPQAGRRIYADARGRVVAFAMHGGLIPKTTLHLEGGKVVRVEGEGDLADQMRWLLANADTLTWPTAPGAGSTFLVEADLHTIHPKIRRPVWQGLHGAAKYFAFSKGYKRAGVLTVGFGTPTAAAGPEVLAFARRSGVQIQHLDTHLYHATVTVDGRVLIREGRPVVFDDAEVRKVAARFGDPDELLRLEWVPALDGR